MIPRACWLLCFAPLVASAASLRSEPLSMRVQRAHRVVRAKVVQVTVEMESNDPRQMRTVSRLRIAETLKGPPARELEVVQVGGTQGKWKLELAGDAKLSVGEEAVFLLRCSRLEQPDRCTLVGLAEGKLPVKARPDGAEEIVLPDASRRALPEVLSELRTHARLPSVDVPGVGGAKEVQR
jgi:hypothetical protein